MVFPHKIVFIENEVALLCVTMREHARASTCTYSLVYNFLTYFLPLKSSVFVVHFLNPFWHGNKAFPKLVLRMKLFVSLLSFTYHIVNVGVWKYVFTRVIIKIKIFHSYRTRVVCVALMSHLCLTRVALVSLSCRSCRTRVARVWHSCCKLD